METIKKRPIESAPGPHNNYYEEVFETAPPVELIHTVSLVMRPPTLEYMVDEIELTTPVNFKRGLFLNLLAFLTPCVQDSNNIVIVYHCPIDVIRVLENYFEDVEWRIVVQEVRPGRHRKIKYMTEQTALKEYVPDSILISLQNWPSGNLETYNKYRRPKHTFLKFPIKSFRESNVVYLDGTICCPVYSEYYNYDFYLIPNGRMKEYNVNALKDRAFSFHVDYRGRIYPTRYKIPGSDNCFDCAIETAICEMYIFFIRRFFPTNENVNELIFAYTSALGDK